MDRNDETPAADDLSGLCDAFSALECYEIGRSDEEIRVTVIADGYEGDEELKAE